MPTPAFRGYSSHPLAKSGDFAVRNSGIPTPDPGELLLKNVAAALDPVGWKIQECGFAVQNYPSIIGLDLSGTVDWEAVGEGVTAFQKDDRV